MEPSSTFTLPQFTFVHSESDLQFRQTLNEGRHEWTMKLRTQVRRNHVRETRRKLEVIVHQSHIRIFRVCPINGRHIILLREKKDPRRTTLRAMSSVSTYRRRSQDKELSQYDGELLNDTEGNFTLVESLLMV